MGFAVSHWIHTCLRERSAASGGIAIKIPPLCCCPFLSFEIHGFRCQSLDPYPLAGTVSSKRGDCHKNPPALLLPVPFLRETWISLSVDPGPTVSKNRHQTATIPDSSTHQNSRWLGVCPSVALFWLGHCFIATVPTHPTTVKPPPDDHSSVGLRLAVGRSTPSL